MKLKHRITGTILAIVFATTSALPAAGIPNLKSPPKTVSAPRVPAAVAAPRIPVVPKVNIPAAPKVPVVKVPAVKVPAAPRIPVVRTPSVPAIASAPRIPSIKTPVVKSAAAPKTPVIKAPIVKTPVVAARVKVPAATKPAVTVAAAKIPVVSSAVSSKSADNQTAKRAVDSSSAGARQKKGGSSQKGDAKAETDKKRVQFVLGQKAKQDAEKGNQNNAGQNTAAAHAEKPAKKEKDFTGIEEAYRRMHESEEADRTGDDSKDPYIKNGGIDRDQLNKDERMIADFENDQFGTQALLDDARKPKDPKEPATPEQDEDDDKTPVAVTKGRIKDLLDIEGTSQTTGLDGDEQEVVDAKDAIARGKVKDPRDVRRLVDKVANKGVDKQFGEAPPVSVDDLVKKGDELKRKGDFRGAANLYRQATDAFKNGGKNSAEYRLTVIGEVAQGTRPAGDLDGVAGRKPAADPGTNTEGTSPTTPGAGPGRQPGADDFAPPGKNGGADAERSPSTTPASPGTTGQAPASPAPGPGADGGTPATAPASTAPAATAPAATDSARATDEYVGTGTLEGGDHAGETADVYQSAETGGYYAVTADGTVVPNVGPHDAQGNKVEGSIPAAGTGGETTVSAERGSESGDGASGGNSGNGGQGNGGNGSGGGGSDSDSDDDKDDDKSTTTDTTTETTTETEAAETTEANDDTAEASEEGTPNPEARERGSRSGRMAEATQGRVGGEEQRNQKKGLDQRKNGNGAGGPNPEDNSSSGVLLTKQEQKAFAKNLGMKSGGGVTTPADKDHSFAVTERDMKDIAARRGSTINPAGGGEGKGGSGQTLGKKGFAQGGSAPAPAPKGAQSSDIDGGEGGEEGSAPRTGSGTGGATGSIFGGTSGPGVSPVRAGAAAASSVRGANVRVNAAQMNNVQR